MTGLFVIAAGLVALMVGATLVLGPWLLISVGAVLVLVGAVVDFDRMKEPQRAKRHPASS